MFKSKLKHNLHICTVGNETFFASGAQLTTAHQMPIVAQLSLFAYSLFHFSLTTCLEQYLILQPVALVHKHTECDP